MATIAIHLPALAAVFLAGMAWPYRVVFVCMIGFSLIRHLASRPGSVQLRCQADGSLLVRADEDWVAAALKADTVVLPWLVVLRYRLEGRRRSETTVILGDSMEETSFRRLRVWLRWRAVTGNPIRMAV